jgi:hypothetical protein
MNKKIVLLIAGLYLLLMGPMIDPLPFVDEGVALAFFIKTLREMLSERRRGRAKSEEIPETNSGPIIDID